jgi:tetratricopeptide (TPR) repeat protein
MTQTPKTTSTRDSLPATATACPWRNRIDFLLLILCSILIAGRCMIFESYPRPRRWGMVPPRIDIGSGEVTAMTVFAALIITLTFLWILFRFKSTPFTWRKTSLTIPLLLLALGSGFSYMATSNKHSARIEIWNLLSVIILGILLIQLLNASWKRNFLLCVLAATGVVMGHRCWEQSSHEFSEVEKTFLEDPNQALITQGIPPGTYAAQQYAARVTSRDIRGYFGVSNTAAAFFILSIMATAALIFDRVQKKNLNRDWHFLLAGGLLLLIQIVGLWLTQSKGGIVSFCAALGFTGVVWITRKTLQRHWRKTIVLCIVLTIVAIVAVAAHGMYHDRLPTNSMWVRWQYWKASADMIADDTHWITGVGPQNFGDYYPRYMNPAAPETVKDPHCLPIALWSQWGLFGLLAFIWAVGAIALRLARPPTEQLSDSPESDTDVTKSLDGSAPPTEPKKIWIYGILIAAGILLLRLAVSDLSGCDNPSTTVSVLLTSFVIPSVIWFAAFIILLALTRTTEDPSQPEQARCADDNQQHTNPNPSHASSPIILILGGGLLGFLVHNIIDFGFFRPGVAGICFACIAIAIASRPNRSQETCTGKYFNITLTAFLLAAAAVYHLWCNVALPIAKSQHELDQALLHPAEALTWLETAKQHNPNDPEPKYLTATYKFQQWYAAGGNDESLFKQAINDLPTIEPPNADYSYPLTLSLMCRLAALENTPLRQNQAYLSYKKLLFEFFARTQTAKIKCNVVYAQQALQNAEIALRLNPNDSNLLIYYADLLIFSAPALKREKGYEQASQALNKALENEKAFLEQQKEMYPERTEPVYRVEPQKVKQAQFLQNLL